MWPAIASIGSALIGGLGSIFQNSAQQASADKAMAFQKSQTDTAHQREVADLKAAGLNPILSAGGGGATSASGVVANVTNPGEALARGAESGASSARDVSTLRPQIENIKASTDAQKASAVASLAQAKLASENSATVAAVRNSAVEKAMYDAGISANEFGAGLADTAKGKLEKAFLESPQVQTGYNVGRTAQELGKIVSGSFDAVHSAQRVYRGF